MAILLAETIGQNPSNNDLSFDTKNKIRSKNRGFPTFYQLSLKNIIPRIRKEQCYEDGASGNW